MKWQSCKELCKKLWTLLVALFFPPRKAGWQPTRALAGYDALLIQPQVALALGVNEALIVQKLHDWIEHNKLHRKPDHYRDGRWWTFNTYPNWQRFHFPWLSVSHLKRLFLKLERLGVIRAGQFTPGKNTKWYSLNYDILAALVHSSSADSEGVDMRSCPDQNAPGMVSKCADSLQKTPTQKELYPKRNTQNNNTHAREGETQTVVVPEPPPAPEKSLTAEPRREHAHVPENADRGDPTAPTPNSAAPLPQLVEPALVREVCQVRGIATGVAAGLMERYGAERVLAVARYALTAPNLTNPAGFLIDELKHGRLDLDILQPAPSRLTGRTSDFVER